MYKLANGMTAGLDETILAKGISVSNEPVGGGNNHVLVIGSSGSGKTYSFLRPNIMQLNSSMVIIDQKGALRREMEAGLRAAGYSVEVIDFVHPERSTCTWNPLALCKTEESLVSFCRSLVEAEGKNTRDPFWDLSAETLLRALILGETECDPNQVPTLAGAIETLDKLTQGSALEEYSDIKNSALHRYFVRLNKEKFDKRADYELGNKVNQYEQVRKEIEVLQDELGESDETYMRAHHSAGFSYTRSGLLVPSEDLVTAEKRKRLHELTEKQDKLAEEISDLKAKRRFRDLQSSKAYGLWMQVSTTAATTFRCILSETRVHVANYRTEGLDQLMGNENPIDFRSLGRAGRPTALFIVCSDTSRALDPLVSLLEAQLFEELVRLADDEMEGELEQPVTFFLDDFASGTPLPDAPKLIANVRSRRIRMIMAIQSYSQLEKLYGADATAIAENCDVRMIIGGVTDAHTIMLFNRNIEDRELATAIARDIVIVFEKGKGAEISTRYDLATHPNYSLFEEAKMREQTSSREMINSVAGFSEYREGNPYSGDSRRVSGASKRNARQIRYANSKHKNSRFKKEGEE